jgi:hypothetical protein
MRLISKLMLAQALLLAIFQIAFHAYLAWHPILKPASVLVRLHIADLAAYGLLTALFCWVIFYRRPNK